MYTTGKSIPLVGSGVALTLAKIECGGNKDSIDPITLASGSISSRTLQHFVIFPTNNGVFELKRDLDQGPSQAEKALEHYQEPSCLRWLTSKILASLTQLQGVNELEWRLKIIPWKGKCHVMGEAISLICGTAKDLERLDAELAKLAKETQK